MLFPMLVGFILFSHLTFFRDRLHDLYIIKNLFVVQKPDEAKKFEY